MSPLAPASPLIGRLLALAAAAAFGVNTTLARLAFDSGANTVTFATARVAVATLASALLLLALRQSFRLPPGTLRLALPIAAASAAMGLLYMGAVAFIPVGLAALIFYTFPLMVAGLAPLIDGTPFDRRRGAVLVAAFAGLGLALGPSFAVLDWRGIALAVAAAASVAAMIVLSGRATRRVAVPTLTFTTSLMSLPMLMAASLLLGGYALPGRDIGWIAIAAASAAYVVAMLTQLGAIRRAGPVATALLLNFEPLVSIGAAALLLGERLAPNQYAGGAVVLAALFYAEAGRRSPAAERR